MYPQAITDLNSAYNLIDQVRHNAAFKHLLVDAIGKLTNARHDLVGSP
ncbi:hypothetical protein NOC27_914 [Nitrosococcus oceani AFC27]|nr:hypothetical protein NOC27_914 [Nitrosococcus oceani AFC27]